MVLSKHIICKQLIQVQVKSISLCKQVLKKNDQYMKSKE